MKPLSRLRRYAFNLLLALAALGGAASAARAQIEPLKQQITYLGAVGVARGQVARLNVVYHDLLPPGPCAPGVACAPPESFRATLTFYFADGSVSVQRGVTLYADRGASVAYAPSSFDRDGRASLRAEVAVEPDPSGYAPRVLPTVEVLDSSTGLSDLLNPGSIAGFNPQPEPPGDFNFGLFNVVKGQTARVNVSYVGIENDGGLPPGPCRVTVSFYDGDGRLIGQDMQSLDLGETAQFDYQTGGLPAGARQRIRASVRVESSDGAVIPCLMPSLEVFAADTGRSSLFYPGSMIETR